MRFGQKLALTMVLLFYAGSVTAQQNCLFDVPNHWLVQAPANFDGQAISSKLIMRITNHLPRALSLLAHRSAVRISDADVLSFTGHSSPSLVGLRPYLIRAVDVRRATSLEISVEHRRVEVFAGNLGCPAHEKTPIIVFLRQSPKQVFVEAMSAQ